jgi:hypothetical protein
VAHEWTRSELYSKHFGDLITRRRASNKEHSLRQGTTSHEGEFSVYAKERRATATLCSLSNSF